jgi:hypothetical protein
MFGRKLVNCDDFEDANDKAAVPRVDFIGRRPMCCQMSLSAREKLLIATPTGVQLDGSRAGGAKFMASVVLDDSTSTLFHRSTCISFCF